MLTVRRSASPRPRLARPLALVGTLLATLVAAGPADAVAPSVPAPDPQITVERQGYVGGQPRFSARFVVPGTEAEIRWRICAESCGDVVATGSDFQPDALPTGSVVRASATLGGHEVSASSPTWWGVPTPTALPGLDGDLRVGRTVVPVAGRWVGGYQDDGSYFTYRLCRTASGDDCRAFPPATGSGDRVTIDPAWAGWYLGAIEHRFGWGTAFPAVAYMAPPWGQLPGPTTGAEAGVTSGVGPLAGPIPAPRPSTRPTVRGTLAVGRTVRPRSGNWLDATDGGAVWSGLRACPTRKDGDRCVALNDFARSPGVTENLPGRASLPALDQPVKLDARYLGWYVGAVDVHVRDAKDRGLALRSVAILGSTPETAVPAPGPVVVHGPLSRRPVQLGFTPRATVRARASTHPSRRTTLATVRCRDRCVARATVASGGRTTRVRLVVAKGKAQRLVVPARATRGRRARVTIRFDHHPRTVRGTVRLG